METKEFKFLNYMTEGIHVVGLYKKDIGQIYEVYKGESQTTALQFLQSIPPIGIPSFYYVIVETPQGNTGKDKEGIYDEASGDFLTITKEDIPVPPQFRADLKKAKNSIFYYQQNPTDSLGQSLAALEKIILHHTFFTSMLNFRLAIFNEAATTCLKLFMAVGHLDALEKAIELSRMVVEQTPAGSLNLPVYLSVFGQALRARGNHYGDTNDINCAIQALEQALNRTKPKSFEIPELLGELGNCWVDRYLLTLEPEDIKRAIQLHEQSVNEATSDSFLMSSSLNNLGAALTISYHHSRDFSDLEKAIDIFQQALKLLTPNSPMMSTILNNLGIGLRSRYLEKKNISDIGSAIDAIQKALTYSHPCSHDRPKYISNLGGALFSRYIFKGDTSDLNKAHEFTKQAVDQSPIQSSDIAGLLYNLVEVLNLSAYDTGDLADVEFAIQRCQEVLDHTLEKSKERPALLSSVSDCLIIRYEKTGNKIDLELALKYSQEALALIPPDSPQTTKYLIKRCICLKQRYIRLGNISDLDLSIQFLEQTLKERSTSAEELLGLLNTLGLSLCHRYIHNGDLVDLNRAVHLFEQQIKEMPPESLVYKILLNNLGLVLSIRYSRTGDIDDLERSIQALEQAKNQTNPLHSKLLADILHNLGIQYRNRYYRTNNQNDFNNFVRSFNDEIKLIPWESPDYPDAQLGSGLALLGRYYDEGHQDDLNRAVQLLREAADLSPHGSFYWFQCLSTLGEVLLILYKRSKNLNDLEEAINIFRMVIAGMASGSHLLPSSLSKLALSLSIRYDHLGNLVDMEEAEMIYKQIVKNYTDTSPNVGLISARNWGNWAFQHKNWEESAQAYRCAFSAIKQLTKIQLVRRGKEIWLREYQGLPAHAAYAMAKTGDLESAVVAMEQGVAQLLTAVLERDRLDLEQLRKSGHIDLYKRYYQAAESLNRLEGKEYLRDQLTLTDEALKNILKQAHDDMDNIIDAIRQVRGYERFLDTPGFHDIKKAIKAIPLVYICVTSTGGLALILSPPPAASVIPLWLPELTENVLKESWNRYHSVYRRWCENTRNPLAGAEWYDILDETTRWLWEKIMGPLVELLSPYGHATIIPIGLLGLLPLHAAWTDAPGTPGGRRYALDSINITYAPNARTLAVAQDIRSKVTPGKVLVINEPEPVKAGLLPGSHHEVRAVISTFPIHKILGHETATRESVMAELAEYPVLHFNCHGHAEMDKPLEGGLLMANNERFSLRDILGLNLKGVRLAVLSACETGISGMELPDEVVSLSTGFLQARAAGVVASLWSVADTSTMMLMARFYHRWREGNQEPAEALRQAQQWMRDSSREEKEIFFKSFAKETPDTKKNDEEILFRLKTQDFSHPFHWAAFNYMGV